MGRSVGPKIPLGSGPHTLTLSPRYFGPPKRFPEQVVSLPLGGTALARMDKF
jgi:hypothetical protein